MQRLQALAGSAAAAQLPIVLVSPYADLAALEDCLSDSPVKSTLVVANDNVVGAVLSVETLGAVLASRDDAALDAVSLRNAIFEAVASGYIARPSGYTQALESKSEGSERPVMYHLQPSHPEVHARVYARLGLMGNPSDTCGGKTVSATVSNFWADVWLTASTSISFKPHPLYDPHEFGSLRELAFTTGRDGYSGAQRLFLATLRKLFVMAEAAGIDLPAKGFKVHFDTNVRCSSWAICPNHRLLTCCCDSSLMVAVFVVVVLLASNYRFLVKLAWQAPQHSSLPSLSACFVTGSCPRNSSRHWGFLSR